MQAHDLIQRQLEQTVRCLRDRMVQAEERLHTQVVQANGRFHHHLLQAGGLIPNRLLQMLEYNHLQLVQMARDVYFLPVREEGDAHRQLQQAHCQLLLTAERIYDALIQSLHMVG